MVEEGYKSSSFSTDVYLQPKLLFVDNLVLLHLELAIRAKIACFDLNDVGNASPRNLYSR